MLKKIIPLCVFIICTQTARTSLTSTYDAIEQSRKNLAAELPAKNLEKPPYIVLLYCDYGFHKHRAEAFTNLGTLNAPALRMVSVVSVTGAQIAQSLARLTNREIPSFYILCPAIFLACLAGLKLASLNASSHKKAMHECLKQALDQNARCNNHPPTYEEALKDLSPDNPYRDRIENYYNPKTLHDDLIKYIKTLPLPVRAC
jgi:hypothetical protein